MNEKLEMKNQAKVPVNIIYRHTGPFLITDLKLNT